ncbi:PAS domain-containing protein [Rhodococcoides corynebacterioides]|uniref:PAS domain S-box protein n=1 Tax=Rhodococcoides corynebacterioides TaxID=53972 RepID=A0ABS7P4I0_9NOCA|nr:PAS domain-containing protein [Rhodococcus corynebacterioides]MBY6367285.1 PAS domain S-box protein [Rhodococcus corynebacterioides]MBY6408987.1 PAS domain S-box protein [Rhodococcus corynebacterioides]
MAAIPPTDPEGSADAGSRAASDRGDLPSLYYGIARSADATTVHDESGALTFFNAACSRLLGYDADELASLTGHGIVHPDDAGLLAEATERATDSPVGAADTELRLVRKDGSAVRVTLGLSRVEVSGRRYLVVESVPA